MRLARFWILGAAILVLNTAGILWVHHDLVRIPKQQFRVLSAWPLEAPQEADRLTLVLNEPLGPAEHIGKPMDRPPFVLQPAAAGHWQWAAADKLEYRLDKPLLPGRRYVLKPSADLEARVGRQLAGQREFIFQTDPLRLTLCRPDTCEPEAVNIELTFNQPVSPDDLMRHLIVSDVAADTVPGPVRKLDVSCLTNKVGDKFMIRAGRPRSQGLRISIDGRLTGFGAQLPLGQDVHTTLQIAARFALLGADVEQPGLEKTFPVYLRFSNPLDTAQTLPEITVSPKVEGLKVSRDAARLVLQGAFVCGRRYTATVDCTLMSDDKQTLKEKATTSFDIPDREPELGIPANHGILSPAGNLLLDVESVNIPEITITPSRLHANNLVQHVLRNPENPGGGVGDLDIGRCDAEDTSRMLKPLTVPLDTPRNVPATLSLDLRKVLGEPLGVYRLDLSANTKGWQRQTAIVAITDLGLTAKRHKDGYTVWVTSLRTAKPLEDAKVTAISYNNQVLATASTDAEGLARLTVPPNHPDGEAFLITAQQKEDLSYLVVPRRRPDDEEHVGDAGRAIPVTYDVMLYCERGVYRPGETIHASGIVRDAQGRIAPAMPLSLRVDRPDGKRVATIPIPPDSNGQGLFHVDYRPDEDAQMGTYSISVALPGDGAALGNTTALVEAFLPVRMEVKAGSARERYGPGDKAAVHGSARYLFGPPAADLGVQVKGYYQAIQFTSVRRAEYAFDAGCGEKKDSQPQAGSRTDAGGLFCVSLDVPAEPRRLWRGSFVATVSETGGRSVSANFTFQVDGVGRHVGLRLPDSAILPAGEPATVEWVLVDANGDDAAGGHLEWTLERLEWDYVVEQVNGRAVWKNQQRVIPAGKGTCEGAGPSGKIEIACPDAGQYRLAVRETASGALTTREFYVTRGSDAGTNVSEPQRLEIVLDRKSYVPGNSAKALVRGPFAGTLLLTVETDRVLQTQVLEMTGKQLEVDVPVPADLRGGAFITASVVSPVEPDSPQWLPHCARGIARLETDHSAASMKVRIEAPAKIEPGRKVQIVVNTDKPADGDRPGRVHLWAVDEGILLTTAFGTPDPHAFFFAPRKLGVETSDLFRMLLPDFKRPAGIARIGGDGDEEAGLRRSPVPMRLKQSTVIWNRSVPVDANGQVSVTLEVPQFTGELRLMAVAVDHDRYGCQKKALTVASPLLVESSWPRFAAPGDRFKVPLKVFNTTDKPLSVSVTLAVKGPLAVSLTSPEPTRQRPFAIVGEAGPEPALDEANRTPQGLVGSAAEMLAGLEGKTPPPASGGVVQRRAAASAPAQTGGKGKMPATQSGLTAASRPAATGPASDAETQFEAAAIQPFDPNAVTVLQIPPAQTALAAGASAVIWVYGVATNIGTVEVAVAASAPGPDQTTLKAQDEGKFTVRPAVPLTVEMKLLKFEAGGTQKIEPLGDFFTGRTTVVISPRPDVELRPAIEQLIDYPYGCVEQTTSRLYAILYAPDLLSLDGAGEQRAAAVKEMIAAGIARLWSMQTRDGGLGYWPGDTHSNLWGTAYAASFLVRAKKAGFAVDKQFADALADYVAAALRKTDTSEADDNLRALLCNVLATFGRAPEPWMNRLSDEVDDLDIGARANLAGAWLEMGKKDRAAAMLPESTLTGNVSFSAGGRITSLPSQQAVLLDTLLDLDPSHPWLGLLVGKIQEARKNKGVWASTHDNAMCLSALAHYQALSKDKPARFTGTLTVAGQPPATFDSNQPFEARSRQPNESWRVETAGEGTVYAIVTTEGLERGKMFQARDQRLRVRRTWKDSHGQAIDRAHMYVGELVQVEVSIELSPDAGADLVENVAIVDALGGGMEVENPMLATSAADDPTALPDRAQFMDDRVVLFCSVGKKVQTYKYSLRVTTAGEFELPPIQASCMYDPQIESVHGGGMIAVSEIAPTGARTRPATRPTTTTAPTSSAYGPAMDTGGDNDDDDNDTDEDDDQGKDVDSPKTVVMSNGKWLIDHFRAEGPDETTALSDMLRCEPDASTLALVLPAGHPQAAIGAGTRRIHIGTGPGQVLSY